MAGIGFSGNDWLGIGGGLSAQRVEGCGVPPILKSRRAAFDECVKRQNEMKFLELDIKQRSLDDSNNFPLKYAVIIVIAIIAIVLIFRK